jgi:hypothetical protein
MTTYTEDEWLVIVSRMSLCRESWINWGTFWTCLKDISVLGVRYWNEKGKEDMGVRSKYAQYKDFIKQNRG